MLESRDALRCAFVERHKLVPIIGQKAEGEVVGYACLAAEDWLRVEFETSDAKAAGPFPKVNEGVRVAADLADRSNNI